MVTNATIDMKEISRELLDIVSEYAHRFNAIPESEFSAKPLATKWSKKEVVGHLVDSAQNNLRRFICGQYEAEPPFIAYQQDFWVNSNGYQQMESSDVIRLWQLLNQRIAAVLMNMPEQNYRKQCNTGALHSLDWLAVDYLKHMKHHINQIISGSFDVVYK
jgi:hypothetical protein